MNIDISQNNGSLLLNSTDIVSAFDLIYSPIERELTKLNSSLVLNSALRNFTIDYRLTRDLTIINGMGVTLGDSIIGISALEAIKKINDQIRIRVIRPKNCAKYVNDIYYEAKEIISKIEYMPFSLQDISPNDTNVDIGNQVYWKDFNELEMHDFFMKTIGLDYNSIDEDWKRNTWLKRAIPQNKKSKYILFCPYASTKLRSIPEKHHDKIVTMLYEKFRLPVYGFGISNHSKYFNVTSMCKSTRQYIEMIANSSYLYTCDSSALHVAAGYNIPTFCIFTSIQPELRSKYYNNCTSVYIGSEKVNGMHESNNPTLIQYIEKKFESYYENA
ncbi:glycosyltransferase family 9 protein [Serratia ureilytica]|uniref:glycosyltransferase family 9 protein n=1 Tax=Serratia ureilytica TaxID=300181 RepID=UPI0018E6FD53|nr:glycosyltransferase family 9 protein [Serratia ureilytica]MBJ2078328.1 hypothetical protein [Serratia ureilytica]